MDQDELIKEKRENRINLFLREFRFSRIKTKLNFCFEHKKLGFLSPIIPASDNKKVNN